jgi:hypothetical protein
MKEKLPAYHEAAHAVIAVVSRFHRILAVINVRDAFGEAPVSVSKERLLAGGKKADRSIILADPEIAQESARIFLAGYAGEVRYSQTVKDTQPDMSLCQNDYNETAEVLARAKVETPLAELEVQSAALVEQYWPVIVEFAEELHKRGEFDPVEADEFITARLPKGT